MNPATLQEVPVRNSLLQKLNPNRFPRMSSLMAAIVGHLLEVAFVNPSIVEMIVTPDGFLLARREGEVGANHFIGLYSDLLRNWLCLLAAAELTTTEKMEAEALFAAKIGYFGRTTA